MSKYRTIKTEFKSEATLIQALTDVCTKLGGQPVLSHANDITLYGYHGDARPEQAKFVVRRNLIGRLTNDLGFEQAPDGSFRVIISEYDSVSDRAGHGLHVLNQIKERYNFHNVRALAWEKGYQVFESVNDQGETVLQLQRAF